MSKITIKDLYLIFGNDKQHALRMLKEEKSKSEILKATGCTVAVKDANLSIREGEIFVIMGLSGSGSMCQQVYICLEKICWQMGRKDVSENPGSSNAPKP